MRSLLLRLSRLGSPLLVGALGLLGVGAPRPALAALPPGVRHYGLREGLPQRHINVLWQGTDGFLWVGTRLGLCRFDGTRFEPVTGGSRALATARVDVLAEDAAGGLWVGLAEGLCRLDTRRGTSQYYPKPDTLGTVPVAQSILALCVSRGGTLYVGTGTGWLLRHVGAGRFRRLVRLPRRLENSWLRGIAEDAAGNLWLSTEHDGGVYRYHPATGKLAWYPGPGRAAVIDTADRRLNPLATGHYTLATVTRTGTVYVSLNGRGLLRYDPRTDALVPLPPADPATRAAGNTLALRADDAGRPWVVRRPGPLLRYHPTTGRPDDMGAPLRELGALANCLTPDGRGGMWVGTSNGLLHYADEPAFFRTRLRQPAGTLPTERYSLRGLAELPGGRLLAGGYRGLILLPPGQPPRELRAGPDPVQAYAVLPDSGGRGAWLGLEGGGLAWVNVGTGRFRHFAPAVDDAGDPVMRFVRTLLPDGRGGLWVGTYEGLYHFDRRTRRYRHLRDARFPELAFLDCFTAHHHRGELWVGARQGLYLLDSVTGRVRRRLHPELVRAPVRALWFDPDSGAAWLGTAGGLVRYDERRGTLRTFDQTTGLSHDMVNAVLADAAGSLWISTDDGLNRLDRRTGQLQRFLADDGLSDAEFNGGSALAAGDGRLLFGTVNGLTEVRARPLGRPRPAPLLVPELSWHDAATGRVRRRRFGLADTPELVLQPNDEFFALRFALADYGDPARHRFAYRLVGLETTWNDAGAARTLRYARPPAGAYVLELRAAGTDGQWQPARAVLRVRVLAPVYARGWFRGLVALAVGGLLYALHRYRIARVRQIERLRHRLAADLHDDVGTLLSQISLQSSMLREGIYDAEEQRQHLAEVAEASQAAVRQLNDVVWSIDAHNDTVPNLLARMRDYAFDVLHPAGIEVQFDAEAELPTHRLPVLVRRNLYLIYKEALHNILKHAHATRVRVTLRHEASRLVLEIHNDGPSVVPGAGRASGHGLRNIRERAKAAKGEATVGPGEEGGFSVRVWVPSGF